MVQAILGFMGSQSLLHLGALSVRLSVGFLVLMAVCSVPSYLVSSGPWAVGRSRLIVEEVIRVV